MRHITDIIIHGTATPPSMHVDVDVVRRWHMSRGWDDIGYHFLILRSGVIEDGRDLDKDGNIFEEIGAHTYRYNKNSIGIALVGGVNEDRKIDVNYTANQYESLKVFLDTLLHRFPNAELNGHRRYANTECPYFDVRSLYYGNKRY